mgnify:CR=1 FL=1
MAGTITHNWNGSILTITSDSGTSSMDLKGPEGKIGIRGPQGPAGDDGVSPSISVRDGGDNYILTISTKTATSSHTIPKGTNIEDWDQVTKVKFANNISPYLKDYILSLVGQGGGSGGDTPGGDDSGDTPGGDVGGGDTVIETENLTVAGYCSASAYPTMNPNANGETYTGDWTGWNLKDASTETSGNYFIVYFGQQIAGGVVNIEYDSTILTKLEMKMILVSTPFVPVFGTATNYHFDKLVCAGKYSGTEGDITIDTLGNDAVSVILTGSSSIRIPDGYYPIIYFRRVASVITDETINSNALFSKWVYDNVSITCNTAPAAVATGLSFDDDYAMDYGVSTMSLRTDTSTTTKVDIDKAYAGIIEAAKNEWLLEANGNINKIPLIIHTDQHGYLRTSALFDYIAEIVNWYDIGKVINLGDTANAWIDEDTENIGTECVALEKYLEAMKSVPYSKRIEVFGNHDTWGNHPDGTGRYTPQNHLYRYFRNIYARRADNYGNFVVQDNNYNVKYVAVSGFAYDTAKGGYSHFIIPSDSIDWIISELEKADGYDVIILSHIPLTTVNFKQINDLWIARKNKTSGSVTDEYGITHTFDFSGCDGELLCALHGHMHNNGHEYVGDVLLSAWFDAYYISPKAIHFVLVDRENRELNVWNVDDTPQYQNYQVSFDKPAE